MQARVKLSIADDRGAPFMGAGLVRLLRGVERKGSILLAAREMGMSYAKAHRILKALESATDKEFLLRRRGGNDRGGARLTPYARTFVERYERFEARVADYARRAFARDFAGRH
ncbi:MAG: LysR family transcriptional regulator [Elusimicrobiota bacterium]